MSIIGLGMKNFNIGVYVDSEIKNRIKRIKETIDDFTVFTEKLEQIWKYFLQSYPNRINNVTDVLNEMIQITATVTVTVEYEGNVDQVLKENLSNTLAEMSKSLLSQEKLDLARVVSGISDIVLCPWKYLHSLFLANFIGSISSEHVHNIWTKEGWVFLETRLKILLKSKAWLKAAVIMEILLKVGVEKYELLSTLNVQISPTTGQPIGLISPYRYNKEAILNHVEIFILLWFNPKVRPALDRVLEWDGRIIDLGFRSLLRKKADASLKKLYPKLKEWGCIDEAMAVFIQRAISLRTEQNENISKDLESFMGLMKAYLNCSNIDPWKETFESLTILSSDYIYCFADVMFEKGTIEEANRERYLIIYCHGVTLDLNELEKLKLLSKMDQKVEELEKRLSTRYMSLAKFFTSIQCNDVAEEIRLTAFSLHPSSDLLKELTFSTSFISTEDLSISSKSDAIKLHIKMWSPESLALSSVLCTSLRSIVYNPRWQLLCENYNMKPENTKHLCERLMNIGSVRALENRKLEFVNVDYEKFSHLPSQWDPEDDGIQPGYRPHENKMRRQREAEQKKALIAAKKLEAAQRRNELKELKRGKKRKVLTTMESTNGEVKHPKKSCIEPEDNKDSERFNEEVALNHELPLTSTQAVSTTNMSHIRKSYQRADRADRERIFDPKIFIDSQEKHVLEIYEKLIKQKSMKHKNAHLSNQSLNYYEELSQSKDEGIEKSMIESSPAWANVKYNLFKKMGKGYKNNTKAKKLKYQMLFKYFKKDSQCLPRRIQVPNDPSVFEYDAGIKGGWKPATTTRATPQYYVCPMHTSNWCKHPKSDEKIYNIEELRRKVICGSLPCQWEDLVVKKEATSASGKQWFAPKLDSKDWDGIKDPLKTKLMCSMSEFRKLVQSTEEGEVVESEQIFGDDSPLRKIQDLYRIRMKAKEIDPKRAEAKNALTSEPRGRGRPRKNTRTAIKLDPVPLELIPSIDGHSSSKDVESAPFSQASQHRNHENADQRVRSNEFDCGGKFEQNIKLEKLDIRSLDYYIPRTCFSNNLPDASIQEELVGSKESYEELNNAISPIFESSMTTRTTELPLDSMNTDDKSLFSNTLAATGTMIKQALVAGISVDAMEEPGHTDADSIIPALRMLKCIAEQPSQMQRPYEENCNKTVTTCRDQLLEPRVVEMPCTSYEDGKCPFQQNTFTEPATCINAGISDSCGIITPSNGSSGNTEPSFLGYGVPVEEPTETFVVDKPEILNSTFPNQLCSAEECTGSDVTKTDSWNQNHLESMKSEEDFGDIEKICHFGNLNNENKGNDMPVVGLHNTLDAFNKKQDGPFLNRAESYLGKQQVTKDKNPEKKSSKIPIKLENKMIESLESSNVPHHSDNEKFFSNDVAPISVDFYNDDSSEIFSADAFGVDDLAGTTSRVTYEKEKLYETPKIKEEGIDMNGKKERSQSKRKSVCTSLKVKKFNPSSSMEFYSSKWKKTKKGRKSKKKKKAVSKRAVINNSISASANELEHIESSFTSSLNKNISKTDGRQTASKEYAQMNKASSSQQQSGKKPVNPQDDYSCQNFQRLDIAVERSDISTSEKIEEIAKPAAPIVMCMIPPSDSSRKKSCKHNRARSPALNISENEKMRLRSKVSKKNTSNTGREKIPAMLSPMKTRSKSKNSVVKLSSIGTSCKAKMKKPLKKRKISKIKPNLRMNSTSVSKVSRKNFKNSKLPAKILESSKLKYRKDTESVLKEAIEVTCTLPKTLCLSSSIAPGELAANEKPKTGSNILMKILPPSSVDRPVGDETLLETPSVIPCVADTPDGITSHNHGEKFKSNVLESKFAGEERRQATVHLSNTFSYEGDVQDTVCRTGKPHMTKFLDECLDISKQEKYPTMVPGKRVEDFIEDPQEKYSGAQALSQASPPSLEIKPEVEVHLENEADTKIVTKSKISHHITTFQAQSPKSSITQSNEMLIQTGEAQKSSCDKLLSIVIKEAHESSTKKAPLVDTENFISSTETSPTTLCKDWVRSIKREVLETEHEPPSCKQEMKWQSSENAHEKEAILKDANTSTQTSGSISKRSNQNSIDDLLSLYKPLKSESYNSSCSGPSTSFEFSEPDLYVKPFRKDGYPLKTYGKKFGFKRKLCHRRKDEEEKSQDVGKKKGDAIDTNVNDLEGRELLTLPNAVGSSKSINKVNGVWDDKLPAQIDNQKHLSAKLSCESGSEDIVRALNLQDITEAFDMAESYNLIHSVKHDFLRNSGFSCLDLEILKETSAENIVPSGKVQEEQNEFPVEKLVDDQSRPSLLLENDTCGGCIENEFLERSYFDVKIPKPSQNSCFAADVNVTDKNAPETSSHVTNHMEKDQYFPGVSALYNPLLALENCLEKTSTALVHSMVPDEATSFQDIKKDSLEKPPGIADCPDQSFISVLKDEGNEEKIKQCNQSPATVADVNTSHAKLPSKGKVLGTQKKSLGAGNRKKSVRQRSQPLRSCNSTCNDKYIRRKTFRPEKPSNPDLSSTEQERITHENADQIMDFKFLGDDEAVSRTDEKRQQRQIALREGNPCPAFINPTTDSDKQTKNDESESLLVTPSVEFILKNYDEISKQQPCADKFIKVFTKRNDDDSTTNGSFCQHSVNIRKQTAKRSCKYLNKKIKQETGSGSSGNDDDVLIESVIRRPFGFMKYPHHSTIDSLGPTIKKTSLDNLVKVNACSSVRSKLKNPMTAAPALSSTSLKHQSLQRTKVQNDPNKMNKIKNTNKSYIWNSRMKSHSCDLSDPHTVEMVNSESSSFSDTDSEQDIDEIITISDSDSDKLATGILMTHTGQNGQKIASKDKFSNVLFKNAAPKRFGVPYVSRRQRKCNAKIKKRALNPGRTSDPLAPSKTPSYHPMLSSSDSDSDFDSSSSSQESDDCDGNEIYESDLVSCEEYDDEKSDGEIVDETSSSETSSSEEEEVDRPCPLSMKKVRPRPAKARAYSAVPESSRAQKIVEIKISDSDPENSN